MRISDWSSDVCSSDLFRRKLAIYRSLAREFTYVSAYLRKLDMEIHKAARLDGGTELRPIYRPEIDELARPRETQRFHCPSSGSLSTGLHEHNPRHDWPPGTIDRKHTVKGRRRSGRVNHEGSR